MSSWAGVDERKCEGVAEGIDGQGSVKERVRGSHRECSLVSLRHRESGRIRENICIPLVATQLYEIAGV